MSVISFLLRVVDAVNNWAGRIGSLLILAITSVMIFEVVARYGFNAPTDWAFESSAFLFLFYIMLGGGYTLLYGSHVNTDIIHKRFSLRTRAILDVVTAVIFFLFSIVLVWKGADYALNATLMRRHTGTPWNPPVYIVLWAVPVGGVLLLLQGTAKFLRDLFTAITGEKESPHGR